MIINCCIVYYIATALPKKNTIVIVSERHKKEAILQPIKNTRKPEMQVCTFKCYFYFPLIFSNVNLKKFMRIFYQKLLALFLKHPSNIRSTQFWVHASEELVWNN